MKVVARWGRWTLRKDVDIVTDVAKEKSASVGLLADTANEALARMGRSQG